MQDLGLQPERTVLSIERSLFSYLIINFTLFKLLINKPSAFFYMAVFTAFMISLYYGLVLINFKKLTTLHMQRNNAITHRLILLSSAIFTIILAISIFYMMPA